MLASVGAAGAKGECSSVHFNLVCAPQLLSHEVNNDNKVASKHIEFADKVCTSSQW